MREIMTWTSGCQAAVRLLPLCVITSGKIAWELHVLWEFEWFQDVYCLLRPKRMALKHSVEELLWWCCDRRALTLRTSHRKFAETHFPVKYLDGREHSKQISHQNTRKTLRGSYLLTRMKDSDWILSKCNTGIQIWAKNFGLSLKTMVGSCNLLGFSLEHLSPGECCDFLEHLDPDAHCEGLFLEVLG